MIAPKTIYKKKKKKKKKACLFTVSKSYDRLAAKL